MTSALRFDVPGLLPTTDPDPRSAGPGYAQLLLAALRALEEVSPFSVLAYGADRTGSGDSTSAFLAAASAVSGAGGGPVYAPRGTYKVSTLDLTPFSGVWLIGDGENSTQILTTDTTDYVLNLGVFCRASDFYMIPATQRTGGALIRIGAVQQAKAMRLRLAGGYRGLYLIDGTTALLDTIQFIDKGGHDDWGWASFLDVDGGFSDASINNIKGGTAAGCTDGVVYIHGGEVDTLRGRDWDFVSQKKLDDSPTSMKGLNITSGHLIELDTVGVESGTGADAFTISGGIDGRFSKFHLLGDRGLITSAGSGHIFTDSQFEHCQRGGAKLTGGTDFLMANVNMYDISDQADGVWDGVQISSNVNQQRVHNVMANKRGTTKPNYAVNVLPGTGDYLKVTGCTAPQRAAGTSVTTTGVTGTHNDFANNT